MSKNKESPIKAAKSSLEKMLDDLEPYLPERNLKQPKSQRDWRFSGVGGIKLSKRK